MSEEQNESSSEDSGHSPSELQERTPESIRKVRRSKISRRTFIKAAVGASAVLAGTSMTTSGQILSPLIPPKKESRVVANAAILEQRFKDARSQGQEFYSEFFAWPWDASTNPYYRNIIVRLPDELIPESERSDTPNLSHYVALNTTCVHLRCLVNPGKAENELRLICPCHGSQYRIRDGVPVRGPAKDLGLRPMASVKLSMDPVTNDLIAVEMEGEPGVGREQ